MEGDGDVQESSGENRIFFLEKGFSSRIRDNNFDRASACSRNFYEMQDLKRAKAPIC